METQDTPISLVGSFVMDGPQRDTGIALAEYFSTKDGLKPWESFERNIIPQISQNADTTLLAGPMCVDCYDVHEEMLDWEIHERLPEGHVSELVECLFLIRWLLLKQVDGVLGGMFTSGRANLFYVKGASDDILAISVFWDDVGDTWGIDMWTLKESAQWLPGSRVFALLRRLFVLV